MILAEGDGEDTEGWLGREGEHGSSLQGLGETAPGVRFTTPPAMFMASSALRLSS